MAVPISCSRSGSQLAARAIVTGNAVDGPMTTPRGPSLKRTPGMPSRCDGSADDRTGLDHCGNPHHPERPGVAVEQSEELTLGQLGDEEVGRFDRGEVAIAYAPDARVEGDGGGGRRASRQPSFAYSLSPAQAVWCWAQEKRGYALGITPLFVCSTNDSAVRPRGWPASAPRYARCRARPRRRAPRRCGPGARPGW